jgi:hypothetical protein
VWKFGRFLRGKYAFEAAFQAGYQRWHDSDEPQWLTYKIWGISVNVMSANLFEVQEEGRLCCLRTMRWLSLGQLPSSRPLACRDFGVAFSEGSLQFYIPSQSQRIIGFSVAEKNDSMRRAPTRYRQPHPWRFQQQPLSSGMVVKEGDVCRVFSML